MLAFTKLVSALENLPFHIFDIAMYENGQCHYHRFEACNACNNSYSVAKVFIMTAIGMLVDEHRLSIGDRVCTLLEDELVQDMDPAWRLVTVEHALTHRIGFDSGFLDIDSEDASEFPSDYLSIVFHHKLAYIPGEKYVYSDAAFYLLSRIISKTAGMNADRFLMERLFQPMKFREVAWSCCPNGYPIGATGLYITTADMLKVALMFMNEGKYEGKRYLSAQWVRLALAKEYELQAMTAGGLSGKGGMYGQTLLFSQNQQIAVAVHAHEEKKQHAVVDLLDQLLREPQR